MRSYKRICDDIENVENYGKALADDFKGWELHHRLETHTSDGERRLVNITSRKLKALGMYYHRPANELIFLTIKEHRSYNEGLPCSEEKRDKLSESNKGKHFKKTLTKEERAKWQKILTKYYQQVNGTGRCKLTPDVFEAVDAWYKEYTKSEQMKKNILEEML